MKEYQVYYCIKANKTEYLYKATFTANNAREALAVCKQQVKEKTGKNAFRPRTTAPEGIEWYQKRGNYFEK